MPFLSLFLGFLLLQTPKPASVSGTVTNAVSGAPIRKVRLTFQATDHSYSTVSDSAGKFVVPELAPGTYNLHAECDGFQMAAKSFKVVEEQHLDDLVLQLNPLGVIAGKVVDENGEPLAQVSVELQVDQFNRNGRIRTAAALGMTDDRGEYRIFDVAAGRYYVRAGSPRAFSSVGGRIHGDAVEMAYVDTWFPNVTDPSQAPVNVLAAGAELSGIDIHMRKQRVFHIRGRVALPPGQRTSVNVMDCRNAAITGVSAPILRDGTFDAGGIQPGNWCLSANSIVEATPLPGAVVVRNTGASLSPVAHSYYARQSVTVADHDVNNVAMNAVPSAEIRGQILVDGATPVKLPHMPVRLDPVDRSGRGAGGSADDAGVFVLENVTPAAYRLMDLNLFGMYLKTIRLNDQEVPDGVVQVPQGGGRLTLLFASDFGELSGKVEVGAGFVSAEAANSLSGVPATTGIGPDGRFLFHNLPPGDYKVIAWDTRDLGLLQFGDFRRLFDDAAVAVTVHPKGREAVQPRVVSATEIEAAMARLR